MEPDPIGRPESVLRRDRASPRRDRAVLRRDRAVLLLGIVAIALLAWAWLLRIARNMADAMPAASADAAAALPDMAMPMTGAWALADVAYVFLMWAVMMVAMMTPSAAPMLVTFGGLERMRRPAASPAPATAVFAAGYLIVWIGFSALATGVQWGLRSAGLMSPELMRVAPALGGALLIVIGAYQFTPFKDACLTTCRSPQDFLMSGWRDGMRGALAMGVRHGVYCLGCCWALMLALFAAGVMNLLWVAVIALYVLAEKALPAGRRVARAGGIAMIGWGLWLMVAQ